MSQICAQDLWVCIVILKLALRLAGPIMLWQTRLHQADVDVRR